MSKPLFGFVISRYRSFTGADYWRGLGFYVCGAAGRRFLWLGLYRSLQARRAWMRIVQIILLAAALISVRHSQDRRSDAIRASSNAPQFHGYFYRGRTQSGAGAGKGKPVMLVSTPTGCVACKEFERKYTFSLSRVQQALGDTGALAG